MQIDLVPLPSMLSPRHLQGRCVVIFDVLRATTCIAAALAAGAEEIRVFQEIRETRDAAAAFGGPKLLGGERDGVVINGFDFGNSPHDMTPDRVGGKTLFLTTTNGTQAVAAARSAARRFVGSFVNLSATFRQIQPLGLDVTLLCSGTNGEPAGEDELAAVALRAMLSGKAAPPIHDRVRLDLLRDTHGGRNVRGLGQDADIDFAATVDLRDVAGEVLVGDVVRRAV